MSRIKLNGELASYDGFELLKKAVNERLDQVEFDPTLSPIMKELGFEPQKVVDPKGVIDILGWVLDLEDVDEFGELPFVEDEIIGEKGYNTSRKWNKIGMSRRTTKWLQNAKSGDTTLPDFVIRDINRLTTSAERLLQRSDKSKNFLITKVLTEGFSVSSAYWPGSKAYTGKALFATDHPYGDDGTGNPLGTNSNLSTYELSKPALLDMIEQLREMRDENGTRMNTASYVTLVIPRALERKAREVLADGMSFVSGEASNSNVPNTFSWNGYNVKLLILDTLDQPSVNGRIGNSKQFFVIDTEMAKNTKAFKFLYLYDNIIEMYSSDNNKSSYIDIDVEMSADIFNYQVIVGSTGVDRHPDA